MALTSPGVEVTIIDQSQYLPAPTGTVPLVVVATAQNKANPTGTGIAQATTAANANKLFQVTSQRDLVTLYGNPFFYTTANGTPIQGYELNEYGLLAAYSLLGATNRCYVLRADIDLASLVGQTGRPVGDPANNTYWLDTTNTVWGIYQWNATTQAFVEQTPIVITESSLLLTGVPIASVGAIGDYAVTALQIDDAPSVNSQKQFFYKNASNTWVSVGSSAWLESWPTITSTASNPTLTAGTFTISLSGAATVTATITIAPGDTVSDVASDINALGWQFLSASVTSGKLNIFSSQENGLANQYLQIATGTPAVLTALGIPAGSYYQPSFVYGTAAQMPLWTSSQTAPAPSGSVWLKQGEAGNGFAPVLSSYNSSTGTWVAKSVSLAINDIIATNNLDSTGGKAIPAETVYAQYNYWGGVNTVGYGKWGSSPTYFWKRLATGPTVVTGDNTSPLFNTAPAVADYDLSVQVSTPNSSSLVNSTVTLASGDDATDFVTKWSAANIPYTTASVTTSGAIQLTHTQGGIIILSDYIQDTSDPAVLTSNGIIAEIGLTPYVTESVKPGPSFLFQYAVSASAIAPATGTGLSVFVRSQYGFYQVNAINAAGTGFAVGDQVKVLGTAFGGATPANDLVMEVTAVSAGGVTGITVVSGSPALLPQVQLSNWVQFDYTANEGAPTEDPATGTNWFYSVVDEVDIMVNTTTGWRGYKNVNYDANGFPLPTLPSPGAGITDPNGPLVSPTEPTTQSDGSALENGDIWINTTNLEDYPVIYRWQDTVAFPSGQWVLIDNTDQTSSSGVLFADARWATNGTTNPVNDPIPTIKSLLSSNYLDLDAPNTSIYPVGMLLFNTRRSGYNVKQFNSNYFNANNFPDEPSYPTVTSAWISASGLQSNGAPYMGRKAQRAMVVASLRSAIDTNTDIRDEDNFFNLLATPNYPELQPNMVVLNADRGETGYILGDTPMGLPDDATQIQAWATNAAGATSTGEDGCVTRNTYLGLFYPSGLAFDLSGNEVAVPASHMMLRTFIRNDTVAFPWFAAAGTRRGIIDNAANIGYLDRTTGEFVTIKTRIGIRDVLYVNFINPLVFFTGQGLLNYGNKTSFNSQSALDRTNVARLVAFIRRQLTIAARPFVFEPNDALTRQQIAGVVESLMIDLVAKRGIYDYLVVCDESNNTPARIDRNELWVDVAVEPVKAAEFIYIPVRILNTGELAAV